MKKIDFIKMVLENEDLTSKIANLDDKQLNDLKTAIGAIDTLKQSIEEEDTEKVTEDDMISNIINSDNFLKGLNNLYVKGELNGEQNKSHSDFIAAMELKNSGDTVSAIRALNDLKRLGQALWENKIIPDNILELMTENENPRMKAKQIYQFVKNSFGK